MSTEAKDDPVIVHVTQRDGQVLEIAAAPGKPLMFALSEQNTGVEAICGGCLSCATCHIYVDEAPAASLPPADDAEMELISGLLNARPNSRLSCQIMVTADLADMAISIAPPEA